MIITPEQAAAARHPVVIVGTGPAGMALALALETRGIRSLLIEAGEMHYSAESQKLYEGKIVGDPYWPLSHCRLRQFGGTGVHWAGWCRPMDRYDFQGWPIGSEALTPHLDAACEMLEVKNDFTDRPLVPEFKQLRFQFSAPVRMNEKYLEHITQSRLIQLVPRSPVLALLGRPGRVDGVLLENERQVRGDRYVLCTGGIENPRLLLWSRERARNRWMEGLPIGNFWMEHPTFTVGYAFADARKFSQVLDLNMQQGDQVFIGLTPEFMRQRGLANADLQLWLGKRDELEDMVRSFVCVAPELGKKFGDMLGKGRLCGFSVRLTWEQLPHRDNKVVLGPTKDTLGIPQVELHWKITEADRSNARTSVDTLGQWFAQAGYGRVAAADFLQPGKPIPPDDQIGGPHHMGGTRMGTDPTDSVVDRNLKVHGVSNLYVGGSSVFRTAGHVNPTLTIVQFSLRLAEHLAQGLKAA